MKLVNISQDRNNDINTLNAIVNLKKQFQSCNINLLLGAGFSYGVAEVLGNIEKEILCAEKEDDNTKVIKLKKDFFIKSIFPTINKNEVKNGESERIRFLGIIKKIIDNRESSILHKIVNVFTTNYDLLIESALEKSNVEYSDGFSGKIEPKYSTANYGIILSKQTSISSMTSEMTTFNVYKVHGSLNWSCKDGNIYRVDPTNLINKIYSKIDSEDFVEYYNKLAIVNPSKNKLKQTVLNVNYYDQLRLYCNELEKNNTLLLSFGFSFADEHILQMTKRALASNPTLSLLIVSYNEESTNGYEKEFKDFSNVTLFQLIKEDDDAVSTIPFIQLELNNILEEVYNGTK